MSQNSIKMDRLLNGKDALVLEWLQGRTVHLKVNGSGLIWKLYRGDSDEVIGEGNSMTCVVYLFVERLLAVCNAPQLLKRRSDGRFERLHFTLFSHLQSISEVNKDDMEWLCVHLQKLGIKMGYMSTNWLSNVCVSFSRF